MTEDDERTEDPRHAREELETSRKKLRIVDGIMDDIRESYATMKTFRERNHLADKWYQILHGGRQ